MDGDVAPVAELLDAVRAPWRAAGARRGPRRARSRSRRGLMPTWCGSGRCRRRSGRSAASPPDRRASSSCSRTAPAPTSSPRRRPRPTPLPRSPRSRCSGPPKASSSFAGCVRTWTACGPHTRRRSCPSCSATSERTLAAAAALLEQGHARARDPPADRPGRHLPAAGDAVRRPHRRAGRRARHRARRRQVGSRRIARRRTRSWSSTGTGTEVGKTWVAARLASELAGAGSSSRRASRCSRSPR